MQANQKHTTTGILKAKRDFFVEINHGHAFVEQYGAFRRHRG
jgi:hypothetical protein